MPLYDPDFGCKLDAVRETVGFRFPPSCFQNTFLAKLLKTTPESMSRKKKGKRRITESDWSTLTDYFDLSRYGCEAGVFAESLPAFKVRMKEVSRRMLSDAKPSKARLDLSELAAGRCGGKLSIEMARALTYAPMQVSAREPMRGGIGAEPAESSHTMLRIGDQVRLRTTVPGDGYLILLNEGEGKDVTCLVPSCFAPTMKVRRGPIAIPTVDGYPRLLVGEPINRYRLYAIWFDEEPTLALTVRDRANDHPRTVEPAEFVQVAACAKERSARSGAVMVAIADYEVR